MKIVRPHPITDAVLLSSSVPENDYAAWSGATTYALGAFVIKTSTHRIYKSLQGSNLNHDPAAEADPLNPVWWVEWGATNRWKMFDTTVGQQTSQSGSIAVSLLTSNRTDSIALLNISAQTVSIKMTTADSIVVYDQTFDLTNEKLTGGWYSYYFTTPLTEFSRKADLFVTDLPLYLNATLEVTLTDAGGTAKCGELLHGVSTFIGNTDYGAKVGIQDYSVKVADDFGNYTILQRAYARRGTYQIWVDTDKVSSVQALLSAVRSTPTLFVGTEIVESTIIYGFYKDFEITIAYPTTSICSLEVEGLT